MDLLVGVGQGGYTSKPGDCLLEELQTLGHELPVDGGESSEVPAWSRQAFDQPDRDRLTNLAEDDGKCCCVRLLPKDGGRVNGNNPYHAHPPHSARRAT